jgi:hypothetical protein
MLSDLKIVLWYAGHHYAAVMTINHYCPRFGHTI